MRVSDANGVSYFLANHLGSTNALTDLTGNITSSASYDSFGNPTGNLATRYQFTGRELESEIGLYYYRARFYDAKIGRFISEDPIGFADGDINLNVYVKNRPLAYKDPEGKAAAGIVIGIVVAEVLLHEYLREDSFTYFPDSNQDKQRHCWVNCVSTRIHLIASGGNPIIAGGIPTIFSAVGNNSINSVDPTGLYVVIFYDVKNGSLRAWDINPNEQYGLAIQRQPDFEYKKAFSGVGDKCINNSSCETTKDRGPIPKGNYAIDGSVNKSGSGFRNYSFRLYRQTRSYFMDTDNGMYRHLDTKIGNSGVSRGGFYLHPGTVSHGFITIPTEDRNDY